MNDIFLPAGWGYEFPYGPPTCIGSGPHESAPDDNGEVKKGIHTAYTACVRLRVGGEVYEEVGYGDSVEYGQDAARTTHELAMKESVSDAFKRCAMNLGDPLGMALWDKDSDENKEALSGTRQAGLTDAQRKHVMARANELGISEEERHRITRFITKGRTESVSKLQTGDGKKLLDAMKFYAENKADAEKQLEEWEATQNAAA
jgi:recombination DNA repair RAD52 pathway protein